MSNLYIHNISDSSALICGDTGRLVSKSNAIRIQKSSTDMEKKEVEVEFSDYSVFQLEIPQWEEDEEEVIITTVNANSMIQVSCIKILSISDGTTFQVGSNRTIDLEGRIKTIDGISNTEPSEA